MARRRLSQWVRQPATDTVRPVRRYYTKGNTMMNRFMKNRVRQTLIWSGLAMLLLAYQQFRVGIDWLSIATLATLLTAGVHVLSLAWFRERASGLDKQLETTGGILAQLYGHDDKA